MEDQEIDEESDKDEKEDDWWGSLGKDNKKIRDKVGGFLWDKEDKDKWGDTRQANPHTQPRNADFEDIFKKLNNELSDKYATMNNWSKLGGKTGFNSEDFSAQWEDIME